jgi:hypothetical protein
VSEEFLFRMFAIPFLRKLTRNMAIAVVLAGFIWGFGHASYPQQPFYIRGVEVGIGGVALGIVMLRFGILPTLVWHYSVDAMYSAMLLVRSESLYFKLSGLGAAGIMVLPVLVALAAYWRHGGFAPETGLLNRENAAEPETRSEALSDAQAGADAPAAPAAEPAPPDSLPYRPLGVPLRWQAPRCSLSVWPRWPSRWLTSANRRITGSRASRRAPHRTRSSNRAVSTRRPSSTSPTPPPIGTAPIRWPASTFWSASRCAPPPPCSSAIVPCSCG